MNFVEKLLANGFNRYVSEPEKKKGRYDAGFNPNNGWMGLTIYHPYERFEKGEFMVELDLSRFGTKDIRYEGGKLTEVTVNDKIIKVIRGKNIIYYNQYGVLPPLEIQKLIL